VAEREDNLNYAAYCGLYCGACAILVASEREAWAEGRGLWGTTEE
jgi:hypothetical protein